MGVPIIAEADYGRSDSVREVVGVMDRLKRNVLYLVCFLLVFGFMVFFKHEEQITAEEAFALEVTRSQLKKLAHTPAIASPGQAENLDLRPDSQEANLKNTSHKMDRTGHDGPETYQVVPGDTLWAISQKFGISVDKLKAINHLQDDTIYAGQVLYLSEENSGLSSRGND